VTQEPTETGPVRLSQENLDTIAAAGNVHCGVPTYSRALTPDRPVIIHLGVGGFFRSHQALYLHKLMQRGSEWAFVGMGVLDFDKPMYDTLKGQDYLYTLASKGERPPEYTVVGSILDMIYAPDDKAAALERMCDLQTKIVSLTITEKGYCWDSDGNLDFSNKLIKSDLEDISQPWSAIGFLVAALKLRMERGLKPFTVLSCDNMPDNGHVAKKMCLQLAEKIDPKLAEWIEEKVPFPVTMVDRITPITMPDDISELRDNCNIEDKWPVVAEDFTQWVIEDKFVDDERPMWEEVGALVVEDVMPYELMKLRFLNGGHSALSYAAYLLGHREVHLALADERIVTFLKCYFAEVEQTVGAVEGVDLGEYQHTIIQRFSNSNIKDQVQRITQDGSAKLFNTMKGPILELLSMGKPLDTVALAVAVYARYMAGEDEEGNQFAIMDPLEDKLRPLACYMYAIGEDATCAGVESSRAFIRGVFGKEVSEKDLFVETVEMWAGIMRSGKTGTVLDSLCRVVRGTFDDSFDDTKSDDMCLVTYEDVVNHYTTHHRSFTDANMSFDSIEDVVDSSDQVQSKTTRLIKGLPGITSN